MRSFKHFGALVAVFALCALGAANAQAAPKFTSSTGEGSLSGEATTNQVFTAGFGNVTCTAVDVSGTVAGTEKTEQESTVQYTNCKALGVPTAHVTPATYLFTANGTVHVQNSITITITKSIVNAHCTLTITPQTLGGITYSNDSPNETVAANTSGIDYHSSGGACGSAGTHTDGTYTGTTLVKSSSGSISWDA